MRKRRCLYFCNHSLIVVDETAVPGENTDNPKSLVTFSLATDSTRTSAAVIDAEQSVALPYTTWPLGQAH